MNLDRLGIGVFHPVTAPLLAPLFFLINSSPIMPARSAVLARRSRAVRKPMTVIDMFCDPCAATATLMEPSKSVHRFLRVCRRKTDSILLPLAHHRQGISYTRSKVQRLP
jgi:hypothetical protein